MKNAQRVFTCVVGVVLFSTAILKLHSVFWLKQPFLIRPDHILGLRTDAVMTLASAAEMGVVAILLSGAKQQSKLLAILWLGILFCVYRLGLWGMGVEEQCPCLGGPSSWLFVLKRYHMDSLISYFGPASVLGSALFLLCGLGHGSGSAESSKEYSEANGASAAL